MTTFYSVRLDGPQDKLTLLETAWEEACVSTSLFELNPGKWQLEALFLKAPDMAHLFTLAPQELQTLRDQAVQEILPPKDWLSENRQSFAPLEIGSFFIHSAQDKQSLPEGKIGLEIEAATAFGTGRHETTKGCLLLIERLVEEEGAHIHNVLDLGCGTGILAMAAAHLLPSAHFLASDNDPEAVSMTAKNLEINALGGRITPVLSEGFRDLESAPFDLIIANILAEPLYQLAPDMGARAGPNSWLILSGLLDTQSPFLIDVYEAQGFECVDAFEENGWCAMLLERSNLT